MSIDKRICIIRGTKITEADVESWENSRAIVRINGNVYASTTLQMIRPGKVAADDVASIHKLFSEDHETSTRIYIEMVEIMLEPDGDVQLFRPLYGVARFVKPPQIPHDAETAERIVITPFSAKADLETSQTSPDGETAK